MAYSLDLRKKVIEAYSEKEVGSLRTIAKMFCITVSTIFRWLQYYQKEGTVPAAEHGGGRPPKLDEKELEKVYELQMATPDSTLDELAKVIEEKTGKKMSLATLCRALQKLKLTRKKKFPCIAARHGKSPKCTTRISKRNRANKS